MAHASIPSLLAAALLACASAGAADAPAPTPKEHQATPSAGNKPDPSRPGKLDLRPLFAAGRNSRYEIWSRRATQVTVQFQQGGQAAPPRKSSTVTEVAGSLHWTVEQAGPDGSATCGMEVEWLRVAVRGSEEKELVIDTREAPPAGAPGTPALDRYNYCKAMTGGGLRVRMRADGTVDGVDGIDVLRNRLSDKERAAFPDETDWSETATGLATLPGAGMAMDQGEGWNMVYRWRHALGRLNHQVRYKVVGRETIAGIPVVSVTSAADISLEPDPAKLPNHGQGMTVEMVRGRSESQLLFDAQRHEIVGHNGVDQKVVVINIRNENLTATRTIEETMHSQVLRVAEQ